MFFTVFSDFFWLEKRFSLSILALGLGTAVIGIAELIGESMTAALADRLGLKRSLLGGLAVCLICYGILPYLGQTLGMALAGLFLIFLSFEFMIVTSLSLFTELLPSARATMMAISLAAAGIGVQYMSPLGPLRLDYGQRIAWKPVKGGGRFHISILYAF